MQLLNKILILLIIALFNDCYSQTIPGWNLVWSDEFSGTSINTNNWRVESSHYGDGNNELECYTPSNVIVSGGTLILRSVRQATPYKCGSNDPRFPNGRNWTSGMVRSNYNTAFGKFEASIKYLNKPGLWPAFWLLSVNYPYGGNSNSGELDIMEHFGTASGINGFKATIHTSYTPSKQEGKTTTIANVENFHTYGLEWDLVNPSDPNSVILRFYVDNTYFFNLTCATTQDATHWQPGVSGQACPIPWTASNPEYILLNQAVGGSGGGTPDPINTPSIADMVVDWIRVYKRS